MNSFRFREDDPVRNRLTGAAALIWIVSTSLACAAPPASGAANDTGVEVLKKAIAHDPCPDGTDRPASGLCAAAPAAAAASASAGTNGCPGDLPRTSEGVCPDAPDTLAGFSLIGSGPGPMARPQAVSHASATHVRRVRPAESQALDNIRVEFHAGSADLTTEGEARALEVATALKDPQYASRRFEIAGHTDKSGPADVNDRLSQARAEAVRRFLVDNGVDASRLVAKGYGFSRPAYANAFDPRNRRVELDSLN
jgi:outer membrane protein OmpA-like peptidoglycan-associated protein